jgi:LuxR family maltose regulon positive regulatory protein
VAQLRRWSALLASEHTAVRPPAGPAAPSRDDPSSREVAGPFASFTPRELEVLAHIAGGDSNKHIARALDLSLHTVKRHVANILGKLDASTRGQAAAWYRTNVH